MRDERLYLVHISERIERILEIARAGKDEFLRSVVLQDAAIRNFEVIGEAAKRVGPAARERAPDIPWRQLAGLRDVLIHGYEDVRLDRIWQVIEEELPTIQKKLRTLLAGK